MAIAPSGGRHASSWRRFSAWALALLGAASGFSAAAAGLSVVGLQFTTTTKLLLVAAGVTPGFVTFLTTRASARADADQVQLLEMAQERKAALEEQRADLEELVKDLQAAVQNAILDRSRIAHSLTLLATAAALVQSSPVAERERRLGLFQERLVTVLQRTLEGPGGLVLAPTRVAFLERTEESSTFLRPWLTLSDGGGNLRWAVMNGSDDAKIAKDIMGHEPPYQDGYLVKDVALERLMGVRPYLAPPEQNVQSYCRVAVATNEMKWGLLCIDTWSQGARLSMEDMVVVSAFADLLAVALSAVRTEPKDW